MRKSALYAFAALCASASLAQAAPTRIRGTIASLNGDMLTIASRDGQKAIVKLDPKYTVGTVSKASLSDIQPNDFIGTTTVPRKDGALVALEVHIFPPGRTPGEGSHPYDLAPNSTMTNGSVTGQVKSEDGQKLTVSYKGGQKVVLVTPRTAIVRSESGTQSDVKPGVGIVVAANKQSDGTYSASRLTVGKNGVNPPE